MWLKAPLGHEVAEALGRLQRVPDVQRIAVMPDVHLANDICVGVVLAASRLIYPQASLWSSMAQTGSESTGKEL
ncbi:RtcB family protein [Occallatibacter riparius]|uniref:RtcB family protein n=1 Tax=Occallatibacter riparius TaxID=1002689 RepID=A0A9J7BRM8_9BACT|nr:RtcB family protein [Occallatibacter riparius]UWZ84426.1 RtcB family protein [Occallatibacter riparius]